MHEEYKEIRLVRDIKTEHIQAWVENKSEHWSNKTLENHLSRFSVLEQQIYNTYGFKLNWSLEKPRNLEIKAHKIRDRKMEKEDFIKLREEMQNRTTEAKKAVEIAYRIGLRAKEIARLHANNINLEKNVIEVREGAKNGKFRDIPIRSSDKLYFKELKAEMQNQYICRGVNEDSLNKGIRRILKDLELDKKYPGTTIHAIRKLYATERMEQERSKGVPERKAWGKIQKELGHSEHFREDLYKIYIKN